MLVSQVVLKRQNNPFFNDYTTQNSFKTILKSTYYQTFDPLAPVYSTLVIKMDNKQQTVTMNLNYAILSLFLEMAAFIIVTLFFAKLLTSCWGFDFFLNRHLIRKLYQMRQEVEIP